MRIPQILSLGIGLIALVSGNWSLAQADLARADATTKTTAQADPDADQARLESLKKLVEQGRTRFHELIQPDPDADELQSLLQQRVEVALELVEADGIRFQRGLDGIDGLLAAERVLSAAALDLLKGADRLVALTYFRDRARLRHLYVSEMGRAGVTTVRSTLRSRMTLIEAEIALPKEQRSQEE